MSEDDAPKSAFELAMERLRKQDAESGAENRPLTDEQRTAIAEVRNFYEAKAAEVEVLHQSTLRRAVEPEARALLEEQYRRDRERLSSERDSKIAKIRGRFTRSSPLSADAPRGARGRRDGGRSPRRPVYVI